MTASEHLLAAMIADLSGYIDRRAEEIAAPRIAAAEARAEHAEEAASQRVADLQAEYGRQLEIAHRQLAERRGDAAMAVANDEHAELERITESRESARRHAAALEASLAEQEAWSSAMERRLSQSVDRVQQLLAELDLDPEYRRGREEIARLRSLLTTALLFEDPADGARVYPHGDAWMRKTGDVVTEHDDMWAALAAGIPVREVP